MKKRMKKQSVGKGMPNPPKDKYDEYAKYAG